MFLVIRARMARRDLNRAGKAFGIWLNPSWSLVHTVWSFAACVPFGLFPFLWMEPARLAS